MLRLPPGKLAVDPMFDPDVSPGGIIIPDVAKDRCDQGIVRYVGDDVRDIKVGDHVLFSAYSGTTVRLEGEGLLIILFAEFVTCIIESPDTDIPGLYFKGKTNWDAKLEAVKLWVHEQIGIEFHSDFTDAQYMTLITLCQPEYFTATREMATKFIADQIGSYDLIAARQKNTKPDEIRRGG